MYLRAEFAGYEKTVEGFLTPSQVKIAAVSEQGDEDSADITLSSVKSADIERPAESSVCLSGLCLAVLTIFIRIIDGRAVEQRQ